MPKWTHYLDQDDDSEEFIPKIERIPQKPKRNQEERPNNKKDKPSQTEK